MDVRFRPIDNWPGRPTGYIRSPFRAGWKDTLHKLEFELEKIRARNIVIQLALREDQIRLDGWPRSGVRPAHPGVILAFDSDHGPLKYTVDRFDNYEYNLRAIALGLESLRRVDRYGITKRGEQYTGWRQLGAGTTDLERGRELVEAAGSLRTALRKHHPDHGGDPDSFRAVMAVKEKENHGSPDRSGTER